MAISVALAALVLTGCGGGGGDASEPTEAARSDAAGETRRQRASRERARPARYAERAPVSARALTGEWVRTGCRGAVRDRLDRAREARLVDDHLHVSFTRGGCSVAAGEQWILERRLEP